MAEYGDENAKNSLLTENCPIKQKAASLREYAKSKLRTRHFEHGKQLLNDLSMSVLDKQYPYKELEQALREIRKSELADTGDYAALTLALLTIKAKPVGAALFDGETVRVRLTDLLPNIREMRRLSAPTFDTDAVTYLQSEPKRRIAS